MIGAIVSFFICSAVSLYFFYRKRSDTSLLFVLIVSFFLLGASISFESANYLNDRTWCRFYGRLITAGAVKEDDGFIKVFGCDLPSKNNN